MTKKGKCMILLLLLSTFCNSFYGQKNNKNLVFGKLKEDSNSYEMYAFYGFSLCQDNFLKSESFNRNYTLSFNNMEPFPRLFDSEDIKESLITFQKANSELFKDIQQKYYDGYKIIKKCSDLYSTNNQNLKEYY